MKNAVLIEIHTDDGCPAAGYYKPWVLRFIVWVLNRFPDQQIKAVRKQKKQRKNA